MIVVLELIAGLVPPAESNTEVSVVEVLVNCVVQVDPQLTAGGEAVPLGAVEELGRDDVPSITTVELLLAQQTDLAGLETRVDLWVVVDFLIVVSAVDSDLFWPREGVDLVLGAAPLDTEGGGGAGGRPWGHQGQHRGQADQQEQEHL